MNELRKKITNTLTNNEILLPVPLEYEVKLDRSHVLITETNTEGVITYANWHFMNITGYTKKELIGSSHDIVRHPHMPKGLFKAMWKIITKKKIWRGYIKHLCKDGTFFWTLTYIQAEVDKNDTITGYIALSKIAYKDMRIDAEKKYKELMNDEDNQYFMISEDYQVTQIEIEGKISE